MWDTRSTSNTGGWTVNVQFSPPQFVVHQVGYARLAHNGPCTDDCIAWIQAQIRAHAPQTTEKHPDYREAAAILTDSPKASAAIARRIVADVLEQYGGYAQFQLSKRIEEFAKDTHHPPGLRENAKYLVQIGDFGVHTQKDATTNEILDVEPGEAEWTLEVVDGLFEHFIVGPERDKVRRAAFDAKNQRSGRRPIQ